jgi:hypothetical protein
MPVSDYEVVIGLEVHCQLATASKMFTPCAYAIGAAPNTQIDAYTLGLPGTLPVPNRQAVDSALRLGRHAPEQERPVSKRTPSPWHRHRIRKPPRQAAMATEQTFIMIKPDGVQRGLVCARRTFHPTPRASVARPLARSLGARRARVHL